VRLTRFDWVADEFKLRNEIMKNFHEKMKNISREKDKMDILNRKVAAPQKSQAAAKLSRLALMMKSSIPVSRLSLPMKIDSAASWDDPTTC
jgi:hypothetical protein